MNIGEAIHVHTLVRHFAPGVRPDLAPPTPEALLQAATALIERAAKALDMSPDAARADLVREWSWEMHLLDRDSDLWSQDVHVPGKWNCTEVGEPYERADVEEQYGPIREVWLRCS